MSLTEEITFVTRDGMPVVCTIGPSGIPDLTGVKVHDIDGVRVIEFPEEEIE